MAKILSIDYGTKKIGLAIADQKEKMAVPYGVIENKDKDFVIQELRKICQTEEIEKIIIGMPYQKPETQNPEFRNAVENFVKFLQTEFDIPIAIEDERLTSKAADKVMKDWGNAKQDAIAASLILQDYLDKN